jgi:GNAT superfamily N-acetyltransferase
MTRACPRCRGESKLRAAADPDAKPCRFVPSPRSGSVSVSSQVIEITSVSDRHYRAVLDLLVRFFAEEGFATPRQRISQNLENMLADDGCWAAVLLNDEQPVGVVTVSTMLYVEWGRLAEIGDLYIAPAQRGRGLARQLVDAAIDWSRRRGCSGVFVTLTSEGEARHRLSDFYKRLAFAPTGRATMMLASAR